MKIRTIVVPMSMTSLTSLRAAKEPHHIDRDVSWAVKIPYRIYFALQPYGAAVPNSLIQNSSRCLRSGVLRLGLLVGWYIFSSILILKKRREVNDQEPKQLSHTSNQRQKHEITRP